MLRFAPLLVVQSVIGLSSLRPRFDPRLVNVGCVVDKEALRKVFLKVLSFALPVSFHQCSTFIHSSVTGIF